jgi:hypothetical protein
MSRVYAVAQSCQCYVCRAARGSEPTVPREQARIVRVIRDAERHEREARYQAELRRRALPWRTRLAQWVVG